MSHAIENLQDRTVRYMRTYGYATFDMAPVLHRRVAEMRAHLRDASLSQIASASGCTVDTVERILSHEPITQWIEGEKLNVAMEELQLDKAISDVRLTGFEQIRERLPKMEDGDLIRAAALAAKVHPDGRTGAKATQDVRVTGEVMHSHHVEELLVHAHKLGYIPAEAVPKHALPQPDDVSESADVIDADFRTIVLEDF